MGTTKQHAAVTKVLNARKLQLGMLGPSQVAGMPRRCDHLIAIAVGHLIAIGRASTLGTSVEVAAAAIAIQLATFTAMM